jgi:hypothetical protein
VPVNRAVQAGIAAARDTARLAAGAASHLLWWVNYRVGGDPRKNAADPRRRPDRED